MGTHLLLDIFSYIEYISLIATNQRVNSWIFFVLFFVECIFLILLYLLVQYQSTIIYMCIYTCIDLYTSLQSQLSVTGRMPVVGPYKHRWGLLVILDHSRRFLDMFKTLRSAQFHTLCSYNNHNL